MVALLAAAAYLVHTRRPNVVVTEAFGHLRTYPAWWQAKGFVYLFSGAHGWSASDEEAARDLARSNHLVFGIDTPEFLRTQNPLHGCIYLPGVLEDYSRVWQRNEGISQYLAPAVLGSDIGGTLAYEAQVQSPPTAFSAAIAVDPSRTIPMIRPFCEHPAAITSSDGQAVRNEAPGKNVPLRILIDGAASSAERQFAASIPGQSPTTINADVSPYRAYRRALEQIETEAERSGIADLPLAEVPSPAGCGNGYAILYSGDGGWRDLDRRLADILASKGMSVVGVDVLRYYWKEKAPAAAAKDLARIMQHYQQHWQCGKVVLIGFSFGADVIPFMVSHLPAELRSQIALISLLSPERTTAFEVEVNGWMGGKAKAGMPIAPEMHTLAGIAVQCIYGQDEAATSLCTDSGAGPLTVLAKSGGHHFDKDYVGLANDILAALPK